jgi:hypothetical protein
MKKIIISSTLFSLFFILGYIITENSLSIGNYNLFVAEERERIKTNNEIKLYLLQSKNDKMLSYFREEVAEKYGENWEKLDDVIKDELGFLIIYENKYFFHILYSSLFLIWLSITLYLEKRI